MSDFEAGQKLYTFEGAEVEFDHAVGDVAYVHPLVVHTDNYDNYHPDSYHQSDEYTVAAEYLIMVPLTRLHSTKPIAAIDAEIAVKHKELAEVKDGIKKAQKDAADVVVKMAQELRSKESALENWRKKYPLFEDTMRFLEGKPIHALTVKFIDSRNTPGIPERTESGDMRFIRLRPVDKRYSSKTESLEWVAVTKNSWGEPREQEQELFHTNEALLDRVTDLYGKVLEIFRKKPDYSVENYSTRTNIGRLRNWVKTWPHLEIPDDILEGERLEVLSRKQAERERLEKQLAEISG